REVLHDDARVAVFFHDVVDADDVPVTEPAGHLRFPGGSAAGQLLLPLGEMRGPDDLLHRHVPVEQLIVAAPDHAHSAITDDRSEPVASRDQASQLRPIHAGRATQRTGTLTTYREIRRDLAARATGARPPDREPWTRRSPRTARSAPPGRRVG